jgi:hypothetical protein
LIQNANKGDVAIATGIQERNPGLESWWQADGLIRHTFV